MVSTILDLDERFTNESGSFTSPNYPKSYAKNLKCIYKITLEGNKRIQLFFRLLNKTLKKSIYSDVRKRGKQIKPISF